MYQSFLCSFVLIAVFHGTFQAALDDYVFREDPTYHFEEIGKESGPGYTLYVINMTSQKWKSGTLITKLKEGREVMVFNATFNNMSVISWRSVLLVQDTGVPGEKHRAVAGQ